ncbi:hypothetical protein FQA39_LY07674 [Lamprigera yunnana]|nr:hypothetical protein FQA39_LY07674 [Lamprigera yunnana]
MAENREYTIYGISRIVLYDPDQKWNCENWPIIITNHPKNLTRMMNNENFNESSISECHRHKLSVDEIVATTIRALMTHQQIAAVPSNIKSENREGCRQTPSPQSFKNNKTATMLPEFSGHDDDVRGWSNT